MTGKNIWTGDLHTLIVTKVVPPSGKLTYEIRHPDCCELETAGPPGCSWQQFACDLARIEQGQGLEFSLAYSRTPVTCLGSFFVRPWGRKTYYPVVGIEYDVGIVITRRLCWQQPTKASTVRCELAFGHDRPPERAGSLARHMATFHVGPVYRGQRFGKYQFWDAAVSAA